MEMYYRNKKGKKIVVTVTHHAVAQYQTRWRKTFPDDTLDPSTVLGDIAGKFNLAQRVKNMNKHEKDRIKKHGDTLFFRQGPFTFVVAGQEIVTIELSNKTKRYLNKDRKVK